LKDATGSSVLLILHVAYQSQYKVGHAHSGVSLSHFLCQQSLMRFAEQVYLISYAFKELMYVTNV